MIVKGGFVHVAFALIKRITIEYMFCATFIFQTGSSMIYFLSESEKKTAIKEYAGRQKTIRQLAQKYGVSYEIMRRIMVNAGYSNGLKVR